MPCSCCCRTNLKGPIVLFWAIAAVQSDIQVQEAQIQKGPALDAYAEARCRHQAGRSTTAWWHCDVTMLCSEIVSRMTGMEPKKNGKHEILVMLAARTNRNALLSCSCVSVGIQTSLSAPPPPLPPPLRQSLPKSALAPSLQAFEACCF
jgi:hypothetical protein